MVASTLTRQVPFLVLFFVAPPIIARLFLSRRRHSSSPSPPLFSPHGTCHVIDIRPSPWPPPPLAFPQLAVIDFSTPSSVDTGSLAARHVQYFSHAHCNTVDNSAPEKYKLPMRHYTADLPDDPDNHHRLLITSAFNLCTFALVLADLHPLKANYCDLGRARHLNTSMCSQ